MPVVHVTRVTFDVCKQRVAREPSWPSLATCCKVSAKQQLYTAGDSDPDPDDPDWS